MKNVREILEHTSEPAPRPTRRRVGTAVAVLLAVVFGWAVFKHLATGDLADSEVATGLDVLAVAIETGDSAEFERAEEHFIDAASVSVVDNYPAFLIRTSRRIAARGAGGDVHDQIAAAIAERDFVTARARIEKLESERASEFWRELLGALESRLDE